MLYRALSRRRFLGSLTLLGAGLWVPISGRSQDVAALPNGFAATARSYASGEELARQRNIWVMEVDFKPMRMVFLDGVDPQTRKPRKDQVWYLAYRAIIRPLPGREDAGDVLPKNTPEPPLGREKFLPSFSLVTYDDRESAIPVETYADVISPAALKQINRIEQRAADHPPFLDSVNVVQDIGAPVPRDADEQPYIYGVAMWKNVDPNTDFFTVIASGFSNGYQTTTGPDGEPLTMRKVFVQKFVRRGDKYDPTQNEFAFDGDPRWDYQPDSVSDEPAATAAVRLSE